MNGPSFEQIWIPFNQGCIVPNLVEIGRMVLEIFEFRQYIFAIVNIFSLFLNYFLFGKGWGPSFEQTRMNWMNLLHPRMLCAKFSWNWPSGSGKKDFLNFGNFVIILKRAGPSFEQTWVFITLKCFVLSLVEIGSVVPEKKIFKFRQCIFAIS